MTVIVPIIGLAVLLVTLNALILPVPESANPIAGFELVQLYVVIPTVLLVVKETADVVDPLHKI